MKKRSRLYETSWKRVRSYSDITNATFKLICYQEKSTKKVFHMAVFRPHPASRYNENLYARITLWELLAYVFPFLDKKGVNKGDGCILLRDVFSLRECIGEKKFAEFMEVSRNLNAKNSMEQIDALNMTTYPDSLKQKKI
jgi:hypothetical protein